MLYVNPNIIFIHCPKTGGGSIKSHLIENLGDNAGRKGHLPLSYFDEQREKLNLNLDDFFKFSCIRNPWDRMVSLYHHMQVNGPGRFKRMNFDQWLNIYDINPHGKVKKNNNLTIENMLFHEGKFMMDYVIRQEHFEEDLLYVLEKFDIPSDNVPHRRHGSKRIFGEDYRSYYNDKTRQIVAKFFAKDIELFGYTF